MKTKSSIVSIICFAITCLFTNIYGMLQQQSSVEYILSNESPNSIRTMAFNSDGSLLAIALCPRNNTQYKIKIFKISQVGWECIANFEHHCPGSINKFIFSSDNKQLIACCCSYSGAIQIYDIKDIENIDLAWTSKFFNTNYNDFVMTSDGQYLINVYSINIDILNLKNRETSSIFRQQSKTPSYGFISLSSDEEYFATTSCEKNVITIWNFKTKTISHTITAHTGSIKNVAFNPKKEYLASCSFDGTIKFWDWKNNTTEPLNTINHVKEGTSSIKHIIFSPDGRYLIGLSTSLLYIWNCEDINNIRLINALEMYDKSDCFKCIQFSPFGNYFVAGTESGKVVVYDFKKLISRSNI